MDDKNPYAEFETNPYKEFEANPYAEFETNPYAEFAQPAQAPKPVAATKPPNASQRTSPAGPPPAPKDPWAGVDVGALQSNIGMGVPTKPAPDQRSFLEKAASAYQNASREAPAGGNVLSDFPAEYAKDVEQSTATLNAGLQRMAKAPALFSTDMAEGALGAIGGGIGYVFSPVTAAAAAAVGNPVERMTGVPSVYGETAALTIAPGTGPAPLMRKTLQQTVAETPAARNAMRSVKPYESAPPKPALDPNKFPDEIETALAGHAQTIQDVQKARAERDALAKSQGRTETSSYTPEELRSVFNGPQGWSEIKPATSQAPDLPPWAANANAAIQDLAEKLQIGGKISVAIGDGEALGQVLAVKNGKFVMPDMKGSSDLGLTNTVLLLRKNLGPRAINVAVHELGHVVDALALSKQSPEVRKGIIQAYERQLQTFDPRGDKTTIQYRPVSSAGGPDADMKLSAGGQQYADYVKSYSEWIAEQVGQWIQTDRRPRNTVERFFKGVADRWTALFAKVNGRMPLADEVKEFMQGQWRDDAPLQQHGLAAIEIDPKTGAMTYAARPGATMPGATAQSPQEKPSAPTSAAPMQMRDGERPQPMVLYHGTKAAGLKAGDLHSTDLGPHFSTDRSTASLFANSDGTPGHVIESQMRFDRPLELPDLAGWFPTKVAKHVDIALGRVAAETEGGRWSFSKREQTPLEARVWVSMERAREAAVEKGYPLEKILEESNKAGYATLRNFLIEEGYDSIKYTNKFEGKPVDTYIALDPKKASRTPPTAPMQMRDQTTGQPTFGTPLGQAPAAGNAPPASRYASPLQALAKTIEKVFSPSTVDRTSRAAAGSFRQELGVAARENEIMSAALKKERDLIDTADQPTRNAFINYVEGRSSGAQNPFPALQGLADTWRSIAQKFETNAIPRIDRLTGMNFVQDYFPHLWKDPQAAQQWFQMSGQGRGGFTKKRTLQLYADGLAAGLEPKYPNPVDAMEAYIVNANRYLAHERIFQWGKKNGYIKYLTPKVAGRVAAQRNLVPLQGRLGKTMGGPVSYTAYAPENFARVYNNMVQQGWTGAAGDLTRGLRQSANQITALELGLSGFHAGTTAAESVIGRVSNAVTALARGRPITAVSETLKAPAAPILDAIKGSKLRSEYTAPGTGSPMTQKITDILTRAGARPAKQDEIHFASDRRGYLQGGFGAAQSLLKGRIGEAFNKTATAIQTTGRDLADDITSGFQKPTDYGRRNTSSAIAQSVSNVFKVTGNVLDTIMAPLFKAIVPTLKNGAMYRMVENFMKAYPNATEGEILEYARRVVDSVDNRFGEMVTDNIAYPRYVKEGAQIALRSGSYAYGQIARELGGGAADFLTLPFRAGGRATPLWTEKMSYLIAMPIVSGALAAYTMYAMTGKMPSQLMDLYKPQSGGKTEDGSPERINMPGMMKELIEPFNKGMWEHFKGKLSTFATTAGEIATGKDWKNERIAYTDKERAMHPRGQEFDPYFVAWAKHIFGKLVPITINNMMEGQPPGSAITPAMTMFGFQRASKSASNPERAESSEKYRVRKEMTKKLKEKDRKEQWR